MWGPSVVFPSGPVRDDSLLATEEERQQSCMETLYELKGSTFCRVLGRSLLRDLRCLDSPQQVGANGAAEDGGVVFSSQGKGGTKGPDPHSVCAYL